MSNKKIISCFQYPVKTTVFTVFRKSFHTGCSNLISMFLYVIIFQQMTYFFAVQISPNMIQLTIKNIIIKKQLNFFSKFLVFYFVLLSQCGLAGLLMCPLYHSTLSIRKVWRYQREVIKNLKYNNTQSIHQQNTTRETKPMFWSYWFVSTHRQMSVKSFPRKKIEK